MSVRVLTHYLLALPACPLHSSQAVTRAKERLILTRPCFKYLPQGLAEASPDQLQDLLKDSRTIRGLRELSIPPSSFLQLIRKVGLHQDASVYVEENHCKLGVDMHLGGNDFDM